MRIFQERRTRISARIKKLQDLFPKSDKVNYSLTIKSHCSLKLFHVHFDDLMLPSWQQTSTADMLDLAVEYIKDLQKQVKVL